MVLNTRVNQQGTIAAADKKRVARRAMNSVSMEKNMSIHDLALLTTLTIDLTLTGRG